MLTYVDISVTQSKDVVESKLLFLHVVLIILVQFSIFKINFLHIVPFLKG